MLFQHLNDQETQNTALKPILMRALTRFRALLPPQVELVLDLVNDDLRIRAHSQPLEDSLLSACIVAWQSMGGAATQIVVEMKDVLLDDIVLDPTAEKLQGGLPPRQYAWIVITNSNRLQAGPFSTRIPAPRQVDDRPTSAHRLKLPEIRYVVEQHHGWVTVEPEPQKGTAFDIFLPTAMHMEMPAMDASGSDVQHILYVDDYEPMRDLVGETLPDAGFQVTCYESGKAAFEAIRAEPMKYAAVVSDYQLLGYSGIDLLRQVKQIRADLPVIIISGYVDDALRSKAAAEGASQVISKTSDLSQLCAELRALLINNTPSNPELVNYSEWARL